MRHLALALILCCSMASPARPQAGSGERPRGAPFATRSPVIAKHGMAATSHPLATQIAVDVLQAGGSAVDAAIAANAALGLMEPTGNGIGGDLFAIVWEPEAKRLHGLNASGRSPRGLDLAALKKALGERKTIPPYGPLPVSVPGCVSGWGALHGRFGKLGWKEVLAPAIRYAREGFPVTQVIAGYWASSARNFEREAERLPSIENFRQTFLVDGRAPKEGEVFANPDLAATLETIAKGGPKAFYEGELAERLDAYFRRVGCFLRKQDLVAHAAEWVDPISTVYRGVEVYELPPNGQGLAALQMLNLLEPFDLKAMGAGSAELVHLCVEAKKVAFADRARLYADPAFFQAPIEKLLAKEYAQERRALIDPEKSARSVEAGLPDANDTIYLCTADSTGMMVSLIQSNFRGMGSGLVPDGMGFMLQDRGELFALEEGHPNVYAPGKRPFHTIIPGFARKRDEWLLAFGVMGGDFQPQGHVQVLVNLIDLGMNLQEAGDAARWEHLGSSQPTGAVMQDGGRIELESGFSLEVAQELERRGHKVERGGANGGGYQAILRDLARGVYVGASEMRKDGHAAGY